MAGQLLGEVPPDWLQSQGFGTCEVCQRILSLRYNGLCPSCFHALAPSHDRPGTDSRPSAEGAPTIWDVFTGGPRVRSSVPAGARDAWSRCLVIALSDIVAHRDTRFWTDLWFSLLPPGAVAVTPSGLTTIQGVGAWIGSTASGATCGRQSAASVASLVRPRRGHGGRCPPRIRRLPGCHPDPGRRLRRACAALLQDPPVSASGEVVYSLRALHPSPRADERVNLGLTRRVSPRAAPIADIDQVRKAVHSFPSTSGAGRSGLRPSHLRDAMRPASSDLLLRLVTEVVNLLLQGEVPESVRPFVCGASIMALRKPNGTLRPIAVGETLRRITSKVDVNLSPSVHVPSWSLCEAIVHTTGQWFHRHRSDPTKTAISVDISNALLRCPAVSPHALLLSRSVGGLLLSS